MNEENSNSNLDVLLALQTALEPYLKSRKTASQIRRILRLHLYSNLQGSDEQHANRPLLFPDNSYSVDGSLHNTKGLQKEYLRCVHMDSNVRSEYIRLSKEHLRDRDDVVFESTSSNCFNSDEASSPLGSFIDLVRKKHRRERLDIIHRYITTLNQKPAASKEYIHSRQYMGNATILPQIPSEILQLPLAEKFFTNERIKAILCHLQSAVFQARTFSKREQKLLSEFKTQQTTTSANREKRIVALGATRNELIKWIEKELVQTDGTQNTNTDILPSNQAEFQTPLDFQTNRETLNRIYSSYLNTRTHLLSSLRIETKALISDSIECKENFDTVESPSISNTIDMIYPYFNGLVLLSNQQKTLIQQKIHLSKNLTKQLKEANQGFDRLAHESHLLPENPIPLPDKHQKQVNESVLLNGELFSHEKHNTSHYANLWAHAAKSACQKITEEVHQNLETGTLAMLEAQSNVIELGNLLGVVKTSRMSDDRYDIWSDFNRNLDRVKANISDNG